MFDPAGRSDFINARFLMQEMPATPRSFVAKIVRWLPATSFSFRASR
jgi:hypothetical protein